MRSDTYTAIVKAKLQQLARSDGRKFFCREQKIVRAAKQIGYVPGEIAFPDLKTGTDFLKCQAEF